MHRAETILVPQLEHFFAVDETKLVDFFSTLFETDLPDGVSRRLIVSSRRSLADTISVDRGGAAKAVRLPRIIWSFVGLSQRIGIVDKALSAGSGSCPTVCQAMLGHGILPVSTKYLHLFHRQSEMADMMDLVAGGHD